MIGKESGDSMNQVLRYIRLTNLIPGLLDMVDEGKITLTPAVELSYLDGETQEILLDAMKREDCTPSYSQSVRLKNSTTTISWMWTPSMKSWLKIKPTREKNQLSCERSAWLLPPWLHSFPNES